MKGERKGGKGELRQKKSEKGKDTRKRRDERKTLTSKELEEGGKGREE